jgi:hypothetical protein
MKIISYVPLTRMQEETLEAFEKVEVRTSLIEPTVVATFTTPELQEIKVTINSLGIVENVNLVEFEELV